MCGRRQVMRVPASSHAFLKGMVNVTRLLDCTASEFASMSKDELLHAIAASEGRVLASESIINLTPAVTNVSNPEICAAMGADILLLNYFDVNAPAIEGLPPHEPAETVRLLKKLVGRPIAINLEPGDPAAPDDPTWNALLPGLMATAENAVKAADMGVDFILITGNPGHGVSNERVIAAIRELSEAVGDRVVIAAGRMHCSGVISESSENIISAEDVRAYAEAGADVILMPAPGTVPGITMEFVRGMVGEIHRTGKLAMTSIGTSQEGADTDTVRSIALMAKQAGVDIHHIGDTGFIGIALPENIMAYSIAIRGIQHTYRRMALSVNR